MADGGHTPDQRRAPRARPAWARPARAVGVALALTAGVAVAAPSAAVAATGQQPPVSAPPGGPQGDAGQRPPTTPPAAPRSSPAPSAPAGGAEADGGGGAPSANDDRRAAMADASVEAAILFRLGAFPSPLPSGAEQVFGAVDLSGVTDLITALEQADGAGEATLSRLGPDANALSSEAQEVLRRLPPIDMEAVRAGGTITISADRYLAAVSDLATNGGRAPTGERTIDPTELATLVGRVDATRVLEAGRSSRGAATPTTVAGAAGGGPGAPSAPPSTTASDGPSTLLIGVLVGLLVAAAVAVAVALTRRSKGDDRELLRIAARLGRAADLADAEQLAIAEARHLTGADAGAIIAVPLEGEPFVSYQSEELLLVDGRLGDGVFGQVIDAGTAVSTVSQTEPALARLPASVIAVPLILNGRVRAVMTIVRDSVRPFDAAAVSTMTRLAPVVAAALDSTGRLTELSTMALVDGLTRVGNRRRFDKDLAGLLAQSEATGRPVSLVMVDVDHFKHFNDTNGHLAGDEALKAVAAAVGEGARRADSTYRFGGEEFCVILADTDEPDATAVAERMRQAVARTDVEGAASQPAGFLTASLGVATTVGGTAEDLTQRADQALYEAKKAGRNRVVAASALDPA